VLVKQTFDTEERIQLDQGAVSEEGVKFIINPYDEYALEEALSIREKHGGTVTALSVGPERTGEALRTALAMGADEAVWIEEDGNPRDEYTVSKVLAAYLTGSPADLIIAGHFSVDNGAGQVAIRTACQLGIPHAAAVTKADVSADARSIAVERDAEGDTESAVLSLPALFTAQQGLNEPRYPTLAGIMKAKKKPLKRISLNELGLTEEALTAGTVRIAIELPPKRQAGLILTGELHEQTAKLAKQLLDDGRLS